MSKHDDQLDRLLRAGAKGDRPAYATAPLGFASRVFAQSRDSSGGGADISCAILCQRAVLCSYGLAALVFLWNVQALESFRYAWHAADVRLIDSAMQLNIP